MSNVRDYYERTYVKKLSELSYRAKQLSEQMNQLSERIDGLSSGDVTINTCGEVQQSGREVDDLCKEIGFIKGLLDTIGCFEK